MSTEDLTGGTAAGDRDGASPIDAGSTLDAGRPTPPHPPSDAAPAPVADAGSPPAADAAPDTAVADVGPPSVCSTGRARVFVTSAFFPPAFGGVGGADQACQTSADAQGLGGSWRAWLADSKTSAPSHVFAPSGGYVLLDGTLVASSLALLVSGPLAHAIDRTEKNALVTDGNTEVWTGWDPAAGTLAGTCDNGGGDWTSSKTTASTPFVGHLDAVDDTWSAAYLQSCDRTNVRLYCFESCP